MLGNIWIPFDRRRANENHLDTRRPEEPASLFSNSSQVGRYQGLPRTVILARLNYDLLLLVSRCLSYFGSPVVESPSSPYIDTEKHGFSPQMFSPSCRMKPLEARDGWTSRRNVKGRGTRCDDENSSSFFHRYLQGNGEKEQNNWVFFLPKCEPE